MKRITLACSRNLHDACKGCACECHEGGAGDRAKPKEPSNPPLVGAACG